jgi:hypothetical protein
LNQQCHEYDSCTCGVDGKTIDHAIKSFSIQEYNASEAQCSLLGAVGD